MIHKRHGVFETNSSSTHAICIASEIQSVASCHIHFGIGEFGWEEEVYDDMPSKASYLYTMAAELNVDMEDFRDRVTEALNPIGITCSFGEIIRLPANDPDGWLDNGYIDHGYEWKADFETFMTPDNLRRFLLSPHSFVITGNDNDGVDIGYEVRRLAKDYDKEVYYK